MSARRVRLVAALLPVTLFALAGCSHSTAARGASGPSTTAARPQLLVTIGADATIGDGLSEYLRDSWPQLLFREALPVSTVFINAGDEAATVRGAGAQVELAVEQRASVVAIWLDDPGTPCTATTTASAYTADLDGLIEPLRTAGARVLVGNLSRAQRCGAAFDDALDDVARRRGATVVDLATTLASTPEIGPRSNVTPSISRAVAGAFTAVLAAQPTR